MQQLNPSEISDIIKQRIENLDVASQAQNEGTIIGVSDGIIRIHGLAEAQYGEMIEFSGGLYGMALNLERDSVGVVVLGDYKGLSEGMTARCTKRILEVPVGPELLGRVVDALGNPIDGKGPVEAQATLPVERVAPGVIARQSVEQPVQMGIKCIDAMVPVGRGQRELIIGDRQIGKTAIAVDAVINQKNSDIKCIYVAIGQKMSTIANIVRTLNGKRRHGPHHRRGGERIGPGPDAICLGLCRLRHGRVFPRPRRRCAGDLRRPDETGLGVPPDLLAAAPSAGPGGVSRGCLLPALAALRTGGARQPGVRGAADRRRGEGSDRFVDGAADHRDPGRRRVRIHPHQCHLHHGRPDHPGDGPFQCRPKRPAMSPGLSVSRVGGAAQVPFIKQISGGIKLALAQYRELAAFSQFASDLDDATRRQLEHGERIEELMKQPQDAPMTVAEMGVSLYAANAGYLEDVPVNQVLDFERDLLAYMRAEHGDWMADITESGAHDDAIEAHMKEAVEAFKSTHSYGD